ncbi:hypothetical protein ASU31_18765 [Pedobacter ginsenosidimutans]|uniref:Uncharacterized protein n=1 Tax=Pedobacter ginsenosidimutans TaxID=687842 RepID=A0A0T5VL29_9SPHI|nr:hypothetical protein ASU31_18765 [Pedobacter ginsenosidimutans]
MLPSGAEGSLFRYTSAETTMKQKRMPHIGHPFFVKTLFMAGVMPTIRNNKIVLFNNLDLESG